MRRLILAGLATGLLLSTPALAQTAPAETPASQLAADRAVFARAARMSTADELAGLKGELETVVAHAPARYLLIDRAGADVTLRLPGDPEDIATFGMSDEFHAALTGKPDRMNVTIDDNLYGDAAFLLGWLAKTEGDLDGSVRWFDRGLVFQPDNPVLVVERGIALTSQKRFADALTGYDRWLAANPVMIRVDTDGAAVLHRARGAALMQLQRLGEAEAAYKASLELQPDNAAAKSQLEAIAAQRIGSAASTPKP